MSQSSDLPSLIRLLKQTYTDSHLITEFLTYEGGEYAIRAMVKRGDTVLTTGMAAAATIELAEDRAKIRAIASLDIQSPATPITGDLSSGHPTKPKVLDRGHSPTTFPQPIPAQRLVQETVQGSMLPANSAQPSLSDQSSLSKESPPESAPTPAQQQPGRGDRPLSPDSSPDSPPNSPKIHPQ
ncbi:MAG: hypothetical protein F6K16_32310, partial [Symploca sp. SIO2B6]|nr:hypothetical protein [Symploca sp. SIO2B6]